MIVVADSSPLIAFAILNLLEILAKIFDELYVPQAVYDEVTSWNKPYARELQDFLKNRVKTVENKLAVTILTNELDIGESEAIILALENNISDILIDEPKGRKIEENLESFSDRR